MRSAAVPPADAFSEPCDHSIRTHGWYFCPTVNGQPTTVWTSLTSKASASPTRMVVLAVVSSAVPPCWQVMVLMTVRTSALMASRRDPERGVVDRSPAVVDHDLRLPEPQRDRIVGDRDLGPRAAEQPYLLGVVVEHDLETAGRDDRAALDVGVLRELALRPPAAGPDRVRRVATLELDPDAVAHLGQEQHPVAVARVRRCRKGGRGLLVAVDRRHPDGDPAHAVVVVHARDRAPEAAPQAADGRAGRGGGEFVEIRVDHQKMSRSAGPPPPA